MLKHKTRQDQSGPAPTASTNIGTLLVIYSLVTGIIAVIFSLQLNTADQAAREALQSTQQLMLTESNQLIGLGAQQVSNSVMFLGNNPIVNRFSQHPSEETKQVVQAMYVSFMLSHIEQILQIRLIGHSGNEVIRINNDGGKPQVVTDDLLQTKADRYYFNVLTELAPWEMRYSPRGLDEEGSADVLPAPPTFHVSMRGPSNDDGEARYVVVNYSGQMIFDALDSIAKKHDMELFIVDSNGRWLLAPNSQQDWTTMFGRQEDRDFTRDFPDLWAKMANSRGATVSLDASTLGPASAVAVSIGNADIKDAQSLDTADDLPHIYLIAAYPQGAWLAQKQALFMALVPPYFILLLIFTPLLFFYQRLRKRQIAEVESLSEHRQDLEAYLNAAPDAIVVVSETGLIEFVNRQATALFQRNTTDLLGSPLETLIPARFHDAHEVYRHSLTSSRGARPMGRARNIFGLKHDGTEFPAAVALSTIELASGNHVVATVRDVSSELQKQASLESLIETAKASDLVNRSLLTAITQWVRTETQTILGNLKLLGDTALTPAQQDMLAIIEASSRKLPRVINNFIDGARINFEQMTADSQLFNLSEILEELYAIFDEQAKEKNLRLRFYQSGEVPNELVGDPNFLRLTLIHLLHNAIHYTDHGNVGLRVSTRLANNKSLYVVFDVSDTCSGVSISKRKRFFKPLLEDNEASTAESSSPDVGLKLITRLVGAMDGTLSADTNHGLGLSFLLSIPFIVADPNTTSSFQQGAPNEPQHAALEKNRIFRRLKGLRVMVVDDDSANLTVAVKLLESQGAIATACATSTDAIAQIKLSPEAFDVILMDLQMPEIDGVLATQRIRSELNWMAPIIGLTARATESERTRALAAGMDGFLIKPFDLNGLVAILRHYCRDADDNSANKNQHAVQELDSEDANATPSRSSEAPWPQIPGMDIEGLKVRLDGDRALFIELFNMFVTELKLSMGSAKDLHMRGNIQALKFLMHKVRSQAATLSAEDIRQASAKVEDGINAASPIDDDFIVWQKTLSNFLEQAEWVTKRG